MIPYLPDIMRGVVERVNEVLSNRLTDPFSVYFSHGIYSQVNRYVNDHPDEMPLIWLVMNYEEERGRDYSVYADVSCNLWIITDTKPEYTQLQRDDLTIKNRLLVIYEEFIHQLNAEKTINTLPADRINHRIALRPFWGLGDINGSDQDNLFKRFVDTLFISGLQFKIKNKCFSGIQN